MKRLIPIALVVLLGCGSAGNSEKTPAAPAAPATPAATAPTQVEPKTPPETKTPPEVKAPTEPTGEAGDAKPVSSDFKPGVKGKSWLVVPAGDASIEVEAASNGKVIMTRSKTSAGWQTSDACPVKTGARVELIFDEPQLHVLCITLDAAGKPTWTNASRYKLGSNQEMTKSGGFEGEGYVDYQTIDLDEE